jgi:hypothetical protein
MALIVAVFGAGAADEPEVAVGDLWQLNNSGIKQIRPATRFIFRATIIRALLTAREKCDSQMVCKTHIH